MRIFVIDPNRRSREALKNRVYDAIRQTKLKRLEVVDGDFDLLREQVGRDAPSCGIIGPGAYSQLEDGISRFRHFHPKVPVAVVLDNEIYNSEAVDLRHVLAARIMPIGDIAQLAQFILDTGSGGSLSGVITNRGTVVVTQLKGGVGVTTIAASLASCWAHNGYSVGLIDLDDRNPHITEWSQAKIGARRAVGTQLRSGEVPKNKLKELCQPVLVGEAQISVVGQPELYSESFHFKADVLENAPSSAEFIRSLIEEMKREFDIVVIDSGSSWGVAHFATLAASDHVLMVTDDDRTSLLRSFRALWRLYRESDDPMEFDLSKWQIVCNAFTGKVLSVADIRTVIAKLEIFPEDFPLLTIPYCDQGRDWTLASEGETFPTFFDRARPSSRTAIETLAQQLVPFKSGTRAAAAPAGFRGHFQRLVALIS